MKACLLTGVTSLALLSACSAVMPPAHLYTAAERLQPGPWQSLDISGEAKYCTSMAYASQNASARQQALANIARACGGEDRYHVVQETQAHVRMGAAGGAVTTTCQAGGGRTILFKCRSGGSPK